ncbi:sporulation protein YqfD [Bacillaceae bacterium W0354]
MREVTKIKRKLFLNGYVDVVILGIRAEQMINELTSHNIPFYNLRRKNRHELFLTMKYKDALYLKKVRKKYGCKIKFRNRGGLPHLYERRKKWVPMAISTILAILLLFILSNMIWQVEIAGGSPEVRYEVEQLVDELGLKRGNFVQQTDNISIIEMEIMNKIENISYVGIKRSGSSFHINIQENKNTKSDRSKEPSDLVATKAGIVQNMYITRGRPLVHVNDFVKKGDVLVTGHLSEKGDTYTNSDGTVIAEVWYNVNATVDLNTEMLKLVNEPEERYSFSISDWEFFAGQPDGKRLLTVEKKPFYFLSWELPFAFHKKYFYDEKSISQDYDENQIIINAIENQLKRKLGQSIQMDFYKILHEERDNDKVKLELFVKLIEDISKEVKVNPKEKLKQEEKEDEN